MPTKTKLLVGSAQYILGRFGPDSALRSKGIKLAEKGGPRAKRKAVVAVATSFFEFELPIPPWMAYKLQKTSSIKIIMKIQTPPLIAIITTLCLQVSCNKKEVATGILNNVSDTLVDTTDSVEEHHWNGHKFTITDHDSDGGSIRVIGRHLSGPPLDFILMEKQEYDRYLPAMKKYKGGQYRYKIESSRLSLTGDFDSGWFNIPNGEYVYIIDNSSNFEADPVGNFKDDTANYSITIKATDAVK